MELRIALGNILNSFTESFTVLLFKIGIQSFLHGLYIIFVVFAFEFKDNKKEYVIYTKNERDDDNNITIYVSHVDRSGGNPKLLGVDSEEEWNRIKDVLRELAKGE